MDAAHSTYDSRRRSSADTWPLPSSLSPFALVCVCVAASSVYHVERDICGVAVRVSILSRFKEKNSVIDGRSTESSAATQPCMMSPLCPDASSQIDVFNAAVAMLQDCGSRIIFFFSFLFRFLLPLHRRGLHISRVQSRREEKSEISSCINSGRIPVLLCTRWSALR